MTRAVLLLGLAACGRLGFDERAPGATTQVTVRQPPGVPLVDFPLVLVLDDTRIDRTLLRADLSDLRVLDPTGAALPLELEQLGSPLVAWVRVPRLDATTTLTVAYGFAMPPPLATAPVWTASYEGVWHMTGDGALHDSSVHHRDGVQSQTADIAGVIGGARRFDVAQESSAVVADGDIPFAAVTMSAWLQYRTTAGGTMFYDALNRELADAVEDDFLLGTYLGTPTVIVNMQTGDKFDFTNAPATPPDTWVHIAATWDGTTMTLYTDGVVGTTDTGTGAVVQTPGPIYIGCGRNNNGGIPRGTCDTDFLDGALDEVRIESVARSPAWIAFDVAAMRDQVLAYQRD